MIGKIIPLGYSTPGARERLDELMRDPMTYLVDIRYSTVSKHKPEWSEAILSDRYDRYMWIRSLGNVNYFNHGPIKIAQPEVGIPRLIKGLNQGYTLMLLCTCANYETCHGKVVVELVKEQLPEVEVVLSSDEAQPDMIKCLSITQPYASWLANPRLFTKNGIPAKIIENRDWSTDYRGKLLLHASQKFEREAMELWSNVFPTLKEVVPSEKRDYPLGAIIGVTDLLEVVTYNDPLYGDNPWFLGDYGFILGSARPFKNPVPYKGALNLFNVPLGVVDRELAALEQPDVQPEPAPEPAQQWLFELPHTVSEYWH